jgi:hypothetical protein
MIAYGSSLVGQNWKNAPNTASHESRSMSARVRLMQASDHAVRDRERRDRRDEDPEDHREVPRRVVRRPEQLVDDVPARARAREQEARC